MKTVRLAGKKAAGRVVLVDDKDFDLVNDYGWFVFDQKRRGRLHGPYAATNVTLPDGRRTMIYMHKLITGWPQTDHINHDGLDNQRANLRPATQAQNRHNGRPYARGTSQYKGVSWNRERRAWVAQITRSGRVCNLGRFFSETDAARAYDAAAREAYGEYAYLNFPLPGDLVLPETDLPATALATAP